MTGTEARPARVCLVGAGPGDPELLTLKAVRAISAATVLVVDDLVSDAVLEFASPGARIVHVGKRGGCPSTPQAFIDKLLAAEALKGENVVRLKGGDPFIFGRGGEEAEHLRSRGIEVEVVNGITSALASAASLGIPLTHREHAHGVILVTGHARTHGRALDWPSLAATAAQGLTLVIYMGVASLESLQRGLLEGLPESTPAAIVQHASLPQERRLVCTLGSLVDLVQLEGLDSPAIVIVGEVLRGLDVIAQAEQVRAA